MYSCEHLDAGQCTSWIEVPAAAPTILDLPMSDMPLLFGAVALVVASAWMFRQFRNVV